MKKAASKVPAVRPSDLVFLDAAEAIRNNPDAVERAFTARELVQCTLPHSDPGNVPAFVRRNGNVSLVVQPGVNERGELQGFPHGTVPRLLLFWLVTEATRTKSRRVFLGETNGNNSLAAFMREIGMNPANGTGKRSDSARLRKGIETLFAARISFIKNTETEEYERSQRLNMQVARKHDLWWSKRKSTEEQNTLFQSWVELGEDFYEAVTAAPVPVDMRILKALKGSSLALDLYGWLCHRVYTVNRSGKSAAVPWEGLMQQLGSDYADPKEFARYAKPYLRKIAALWRKDRMGKPGLNLDFVRGGMRIAPGSLLSVPEQVQQLGA